MGDPIGYTKLKSSAEKTGQGEPRSSIFQNASFTIKAIIGAPIILASSTVLFMTYKEITQNGDCGCVTASGIAGSIGMVIGALFVVSSLKDLRRRD